MYLMDKAFKYLASALLIGAVATSAHAQSTEEIKSRGKISVAMDMGSPPYAFTNEQQQPQGYDYEAAKGLADYLGVTLEVVPTTGQGRIPSLLTRKADVVIATFTYTKERGETVDFSDPYGTHRSVIIARKSVDLKSNDGMAGQSIGFTRGTTSEQDLPKNPATASARLVRFDDDATLMAALASGQVDSINTADSRIIALNDRFGDEFDIKLELSRTYMGIGLRKGNQDLLDTLNAYVAENMENGTFKASYEKWLRQDFPKMPKLSEIQ